jgi:hypothetical protein
MAWSIEWTLAIGFSVSVLVDALGRVLCLEARAGNRVLIFCSVGCQVAGLAGLVAFGVFVPAAGLVIGLSFAVMLQFAAAVLFTAFLKSVAVQLGGNALVNRVAALRRGLFASLLAMFGLNLALLIVLSLVAIITLFTLGFGLYLAIPAGALVLLPIAILVLWVVASMYYQYGAALSELIHAINAADADLKA